MTELAGVDGLEWRGDDVPERCGDFWAFSDGSGEEELSRTYDR